MTIDKIEALDKRRCKVFLEGDFAFVLYNGEIRRYHLEEGRELPESVYEEILREIVCRRARERALFLLKSTGRTELELRRKLKSSWYPQCAIDEAVSFLKRYYYIDDAEYARNYVELYGKKKSRAELMQTLRQKGIDPQLIKDLWEELEPDTAGQIQRILIKRGFNADRATLKEKQKTISYLLRRGFSWEEIRKAGENLSDMCGEE